MKSRLNAIRGFPDTFGSGIDGVERVFGEFCRRFGFKKIRTPVLEYKEVFTRSVDELVASKELFTFETRSGKEVSLRPENTAGVVRALLQSERLSKNTSPYDPLKYYYCGPMFRYERPQKGRFRQFYQFGVELIGSNDSFGDVETIALANSALSELGLGNGEHFQLQINSLGDAESSLGYESELKQFMNRHLTDLSGKSRQRLEQGKVLRFLDSKADCDIQLRDLQDFPLLTEHLGESSRERFEQVQRGLEYLNIPFQVCPTLVRGLDYYSHTAFEFVAIGKAEICLGRQQGTILAGGRYDNLVYELGGPSGVSGVGWAAGVERLGLLLENIHGNSEADDTFDISVISVRDSCKIVQPSEIDRECLRMAHLLRQQGYSVHFCYSGKTKKQMNLANGRAKAALIIGEEELLNNRVKIREMSSGIQTEHEVDPKNPLKNLLKLSEITKRW